MFQIGVQQHEVRQVAFYPIKINFKIKPIIPMPLQIKFNIYYLICN